MDGPAGRLRDLEAEVVWLRAHVEDLEHEHSEALGRTPRRGAVSFLLTSLGWVGRSMLILMMLPFAEPVKINNQMAQDLKATVSANEELHRLREGAEGWEASAVRKFQLEKEGREV
jgi:hypothetical protein